MPYEHLSATERGQIQVLHSQGRKNSEIARELRRDVSTIGRELKRNGEGGYDARRAQSRYEQRRLACVRGRSLDDLALRSYVLQKLGEAWSPEQISGRLWHEHPGKPRMRISHETIYRSLYEDERLHAFIGHLRRRHARRHKRGQRKAQRHLIANRVSIEQRPPAVERLERYGDWEGDLILGAGQQGAVLTLAERKSMFLCARPLASKSANEVTHAIVEALHELPAPWRRTLTCDNGSEFTAHQQFAQKLDIDVYFAHPYASYERGRIENANGLLRQYLPKSMSLKQLTNKKLQRCIKDLNDRPRKKLGYRTPAEVFLADTIALTV
jgi:IS30 family transposase